MCKKASPSDDEMIAMAKEDRPISREELGISPSTTSDGMQYLGEGFDFLQFSDHDSDVYKGNDD